MLFSHGEATAASFDQRRPAKDQAAFGAGEAKVVIAVGFTETPDLVHHSSSPYRGRNSQPLPLSQ